MSDIETLDAAIRTVLEENEQLKARGDAALADLATMRSRAYWASHSVAGIHSSACITWGDDGQGAGQLNQSGACSCGAWPTWLKERIDAARALHYDVEGWCGRCAHEEYPCATDKALKGEK